MPYLQMALKNVQSIVQKRKIKQNPLFLDIEQVVPKTGKASSERKDKKMYLSLSEDA